jgi:AraC-like DNA-binding protein
MRKLDLDKTVRTKDQQSELATTIDQWREALACAEAPRHLEGKTLIELATELKINARTLYDRLQKAVQCRTCKKYRDYRNHRLVNVYVLEKKDGN